MALWLLFVVAVLLVSAQLTIPELCATQLYQSYLPYANPALLLPSIQPITTREGSDSRGQYVELTMRFQEAAAAYADRTSAGTTFRPPVVNYMSFDVPWCTTDVVLTCASSSGFSVSKTAYCDVRDHDFISSQFYKGRTYVYSDQSEPCLGKSVTARLYNTIIRTTNSLFTTITYDKDSLFVEKTRPPRVLNNEEAIEDYRDTWCLMTGNYSQSRQYEADPRLRRLNARTQHRCRFSSLATLGCPTLRPLVGRSIDLIPQYQCVHRAPGLSTPLMLWSITSYEQIAGVEFALTVNGGTCALYDSACASRPTQSFQFPLIVGRRGYVTSRFTELGKSVLVIWNGTDIARKQVIEARYTLAPRDNIIGDIPCVCGLNLICSGTQVLTIPGDTIAGFNSRVSPYIVLNNAIPVADAGGDQSIAYRAQDFLVIDGSRSFDPDDRPGKLVYYWKLYSKPTNAASDPISATVERQKPVLNISARNLALGNYTFVLYVGDSQDVAFDVVSVIVRANIVRAIVPNDFETTFTLLEKCPLPLGIEPNSSQCIPLNGTASFGTNPAYTLSYKWSQIAGKPIRVPFRCDETRQLFVEGLFNDSRPLACFTPSEYGEYGFMLNVSDNESSVVQRLFVDVKSVFDRPIDSDNNSFTNPPDAPSRNYSDPRAPSQSFPDFSVVPTKSHVPIDDPSNITTSNEFFRVLPEPTLLEKIVLYVILSVFAVVVIALTGYNLAKGCSIQEADDDDD